VSAPATQPPAPAPARARVRRARLIPALAVTAFCAVMWGLLIRVNLRRPSPADPGAAYANLLAPGQDERTAEWGLFLGPQRVGGSTMRVQRNSDGTLALRTVVRVDPGAAGRLAAGLTGTLQVEFRSIISPLRGLLSWQIESEALSTSLLGAVRDGRMMIRGNLQGVPVRSEIPFDPHGLLSEAFSPLTAVPASLSGQKVGQSWSAAMVNPLTGTLQDVTLRIAAVRRVPFGEQTALAYELAFTGPAGRWTSWVTESGQVLIQGTPFGLTLRREDLTPEALRALTPQDAPPVGPGRDARGCPVEHGSGPGRTNSHSLLCPLEGLRWPAFNSHCRCTPSATT